MPNAPLIALVLLVVGALPGVACEAERRVMFDKPATLLGTLAAGKGHHDAQGAFDYVYLVLEAPLCVDGAGSPAGDEDAPQSIAEPVTRVQIAGEASNGKLPIGSRVSVEGTLFPAHTMWHAEPVLIDAADVKAQ
jgi:hypothetical protein